VRESECGRPGLYRSRSFSDGKVRGLSLYRTFALGFLAGMADRNLPIGPEVPTADARIATVQTERHGTASAGTQHRGCDLLSQTVPS
jgi:hypothetical protein